jgi:2'-5' RNA ligase
MPDFYASFDDAWRAFENGAPLTPIAEQRERFLAGRAQFLGFQAPLPADAAGEIEAVQDQLADVESLYLFEREMLHITVRGVGFQVIAKPRPDEVLREDVGRIAERAAKALRSAPIDVSIGAVNVFPDALVLEVHDGGALGAIRDALDATGAPDTFAYPVYLPHVTIAVFRSAEAGADLRDRLPPLRARPPVRTTLTRIELARWWFTGDDVSAHPEIDVVRSYRLRA